MTDEHTPTEKPSASRQSLLVPIAIVVGLLALIGVVLWTFSRVLLQVEPETATAIALLVAVAIVGILSFAATRTRVTNSSLLTVVVGVVGVSMLLSGVALNLNIGGEETGPTAVTIAIAAPEGAAVSGYDQAALTAPADTPLTIAFNNQDPGVQHNIDIATADAAAQPLFTGELITGPMQIDYAVEPLAEGEYAFFCKVHPSTMKGTLTVSPGATPGTNTTSGQVIAAQNIAFDTDTLEFSADTPSTLTFQNNDGGVPHNVAIYTDESASEVLFQGETITGPDSIDYQIPAIPEGSYFFRCDVHPNMNGTVNVTAGAGGGGGGASPSESASASPSESASAPPSGSVAPPSESAAPPAGGVTVTAQGLAFSPTEISLPAGEASTITFDNQDGGVPHNIDIFSDDTYTTSLWKGELITGVATQDYEVPALDPGTYPFRCDVHTTMTGTVTVG
jgi:plastocyanin